MKKVFLKKDDLVSTRISDAPCSATGSRPKPVNLHISERQILNYQKLQRKLIAEAVRLLKPGGILCYSTCSVRAEENQENTKHIESKYGLELLEENSFNPFSEKSTLVGGINRIEVADALEDTIGYYCACLRKP